MTRSAIKVNYHESDSFSYFLEQEPLARDLLNSFVENKFKDVLEILDKQSSRYMLDIHLSRHVHTLVLEIRKRCVVLYFQPFASVELKKMGAAFGLDLEAMELLAVELIQEGRIKARVDSTKKLLLAKQIDSRVALYQRATKAAVQTNKTTEKLLLRMRLIQADLIVRAPRGQGHNQSGPPQPQSAFVADFYASGA